MTGDCSGDETRVLVLYDRGVPCSSISGSETRNLKQMCRWSTTNTRRNDYWPALRAVFSGSPPRVAVRISPAICRTVRLPPPPGLCQHNRGPGRQYSNSRPVGLPVARRVDGHPQNVAVGCSSTSTGSSTGRRLESALGRHRPDLRVPVTASLSATVNSLARRAGRHPDKARRRRPAAAPAEPAAEVDPPKGSPANRAMSHHPRAGRPAVHPCPCQIRRRQLGPGRGDTMGAGRPPAVPGRET